MPQKINQCPYCDKEMDKLDDRCPKKTIYGCDPCNTVFEVETGPREVTYTQQLGLSYMEYLKLRKNKA